MFNGIVEGVGTVQSIENRNGCHRVSIAMGELVEGMKVGDSLAVNGTCLTLVSLDGNGVAVDIIPESLERTNLEFLAEGTVVNLERAMLADSRVNGHLVTGHVDGTTRILAMERDGDAVNVTFEMPAFWRDCFLEKGCVAIDGMSLTIANVVEGGFVVSFIPHTQQVTLFPHYEVGSLVNIEVDYFTKIISARCTQYFECKIGKS